MKGTTVLISTFIVISRICSVILEITVKPRDTEAVVGQPTYLNCSTSERSKGIRWYYYPVGSHESTYIYFTEALLPEYQSRARLEKDEGTGTFNLVILTVQSKDAGKYFCQEEGGNQRYSLAELIVLDNVPVCEPSTRAEGVMGPNACGFEEEEIPLSCVATYHGNIPPKIEWEKNGQTLIINQENLSGYVTSTLVIPSDLIVTSSAIACQTTRSAVEQYGSSPLLNQIKILYGFNNFVVTQKTLGDKGTCIANTSQSCTYRWIWMNDVREENISDHETVTLQRQGLYRCEAVCSFREKQCLLVAGIVQVPTADDDFPIIGVSLGIGLGLFILGLIFGTIGGALAWRRRVYSLIKDMDNEEKEAFLKRNQKSLP